MHLKLEIKAQKVSQHTFNKRSPESYSLSGLLLLKLSLSHQDSNLDKQNQKLLCYHYTIGQAHALSVKKQCKDNAMQVIFQIFLDFFV